MNPVYFCFAILLIVPVALILYEIAAWMRAEVRLKEEELRGLKAHNQRHFSEEELAG